MANLPQRSDFEAKFTSKEDFKAFLMQHSSMLGIHAWKNGKFAYRQDEATPSCIPNQGWFYDFGSGKSGNIIDLIMLGHNLGSDTEGFKSACRIAEDMLNMPRTNDYNGLATNNNSFEKVYKPAIDPEEIVQWKNNKLLNKGLFDSLYQGLARNLTPERRDFAENKLDIGLLIEDVVLNKGENNEYSFTDRRVIIPFIEESGDVFNYCAYNRNSKLKGRKRTDGKPALAGEHLIKSFGSNVLWAEGDSDYVHAHGYDLDAVTAGSASMRITQFLPKLHKKTIYFLVDNDLAGATAIARWHVEIMEHNASLQMKEDAIIGKFLWWSDVSFNKAKIEIERLIHSYYVKKMVPNHNELAYKAIQLLDLSTLLNDGIVRKKGYDLVDYISEFGKSSLQWFESMFKS